MGGSASVDDASAGSLVINGSAICQADSRGTGGNKGNECRKGRSSKGGEESQIKKGTEREDKAENGIGKKNRKEADKGCSDCSS